MNKSNAQQANKSIKYISWENFIVFEKNNTITWHEMERDSPDEIIHKGTYSLKIEDSVPFVYVDFADGLSEKWLMLANGTVCDIFRPNGQHIHTVTGSVNRTEIIFPAADIINSTSFLTEGNIQYLPQNLKLYYKDNNPWVEGVPGQGINEKLYFENLYCDKGTMQISIGYVSYDKPYLYTQNSRPKKIKLSVEGKFSVIIDLLDTPKYQQINIPDKIINEVLIMEILEVYAGTKYEDTCINTVLFELNSGYYEYNKYWE
ncbi:hypothetical protein AGMMS49579_10990 [Spirochaetia bacterium]|nr:hypothetical protein AGMMS49579_10990 [Spirochaetia bacterium]